MTKPAVKRFVVFGNTRSYRFGGWNDFRGSRATKKKALELVESLHDCYWAHVVDTMTGEVVKAVTRSNPWEGLR